MTFIERSPDAKFYYEDAGHGPPPLLFVHGIGCDGGDFAPFMAALGSAHRVVALDLRGHGRSSPAPDGVSIHDYVDDLEWSFREIGLRRPLVVGHSLGGVIALELARRTPSLLSGIVSIDAPVCLPAAMGDILAPQVAALHTSGWKEAIVGLVGGFADPTRDPKAHQRLLDRLTSQPQALLTSAFDSFATWNGEAALGGCSVPILHIASQLPIDPDRLTKLAKGVRIERLAGVGHFAHIEVPDAVIPLIARFAASIASQ